jgi:hypothetical protein
VHVNPNGLVVLARSSGTHAAVMDCAIPMARVPESLDKQ